MYLDIFFVHALQTIQTLISSLIPLSSPQTTTVIWFSSRPFLDAAFIYCYIPLGSKYVSLYLNGHIVYFPFYTVFFSTLTKTVLSSQRDPLPSLKLLHSILQCGFTVFYLFILLLMLNFSFPSLSNSFGTNTCSDASISLEFNSRSKTGSKTCTVLIDTDKIPVTSLTPTDSM